MCLLEYQALGLQVQGFFSDNQFFLLLAKEERGSPHPQQISRIDV